MTSPPSPLIWFLLLDSSTGEPFKGTTSEKVPIIFIQIYLVTGNLTMNESMNYHKYDYLQKPFILKYELLNG